MGFWRIAGVVIAVVVGAAAIGANFVHVPYVIISPGDATPLDNQVVTVSGARTYPHSGEFLYLTVRLSNHDPSVWRWLFATLNGDDTVEKKADVIGGCASYTESARLNELLMQASQSDAKTVALQHADAYRQCGGQRRVRWTVRRPDASRRCDHRGRRPPGHDERRDRAARAEALGR